MADFGVAPCSLVMRDLPLRQLVLNLPPVTLIHAHVPYAASAIVAEALRNMPAWHRDDGSIPRSNFLMHALSEDVERPVHSRYLHLRVDVRLEFLRV